ncbi:hypothetical protein B0H19DRAFT_1121785 [Mycena capillaripes]|nr:hypothetical protein B0H19DRAFT_1121785 [Mycena capillaripes]
MCRKTVNLAFFDMFPSYKLHDVLEALQLQRLSTRLDAMFGPKHRNFAHGMFSHLTHLDIRDFGDQSWETWSGLARMPHLTHLSFHDDYIPKSVIHSALVECPSLTVLVIVFSTQILLDEFLPHPIEFITDPRFVVLLVADPLTDWEAGAWGGEDYWFRAERLVEKRRSEGSLNFTMEEVERKMAEASVRVEVAQRKWAEEQARKEASRQAIHRQMELEGWFDATSPLNET